MFDVVSQVFNIGCINSLSETTFSGAINKRCCREPALVVMATDESCPMTVRFFTRLVIKKWKKIHKTEKICCINKSKIIKNLPDKDFGGHDA